jgi:hypothetical protein
MTRLNVPLLNLSGVLTQRRRRYDWVSCLGWFVALTFGALFWLAVLYGIRLGFRAVWGG